MKSQRSKLVMSDYKMFRQKKFLNSLANNSRLNDEHCESLLKEAKENTQTLSHEGKILSSLKNPNDVVTFGIVTEELPEYYEIHRLGNRILMFNDHEYLEREFTNIFNLEERNNDTSSASPEGFQGKSDFLSKEKEIDFVNKSHRNLELIQEIQKIHDTFENSLVIFCVLDESDGIEDLFYSEKTSENEEDHMQNSEKSKQKSNYGIDDEIYGWKRVSDDNLLIRTVESLLNNKKQSSIITISIMAIKSDGSLTDELNYEWIDDTELNSMYSKMRVITKNKLKVKKLKDEIKIFELNRQQIGNLEECKEILYHYFNIKEYVENLQSQFSNNLDKIGELYEFYECEIDTEFGYITKTLKKKYILKLNQYLPLSNLVLSKINSQIFGNLHQTIERDCPVTMFLGDLIKANCIGSQRNQQNCEKNIHMQKNNYDDTSRIGGFESNGLSLKSNVSEKNEKGNIDGLSSSLNVAPISENSPGAEFSEKKTQNHGNLSNPLNSLHSTNTKIVMVNQLATTNSVKEEAICLRGSGGRGWKYFKNYKDKPEIIEIVKNVGIAFVPKNLQEIKEIKEISINGYGKIRERSIEIAKESEKITGKSFFMDTYSSNEKKKTFWERRAKEREFFSPYKGEFNNFQDDGSYICGISEKPSSEGEEN